MEYKAVVTIFNTNLQPTQNTYEGTKSSIASSVYAAINNASSFHDIQVIIIPKAD